MTDDTLLEARDITKRYPGNVALDHITYRVQRNQINVLIGENGAGKSTLMRILSGVERADEGTLLLDGDPIQVTSPRDAAAYGISIVHQELSVMPNLSVSENIFAGRELTRAAFIDTPAQNARSAQALTRLHQLIAVATPAGRLSLGARQLIELARALAHGSRLLILDEPTSALSTAEADALFEVLAELKNSGVTIIYISHRLHELLHLGDHFTVLRSGRIVGQAPRTEVTRQWIVERMTGGHRADDVSAYTTGSDIVALEVTRLTLLPSLGAEQAQSPVHAVSFSLHKGEILGIYGLLGAGRTETLEALAGLRPIASGKVTVAGKPVALTSVDKAVKAGIVLVPEDRQRDGLIPEMSIRENIALAATGGAFLTRSAETARTRALADTLAIAARDLELPVTALSGGNQQKVLIARCLMRNPSVLLLDEPTRGVDDGARAEIYRVLRKLAADGLSILFTSSEVDETRLLADRALVLRQGHIAAELPRDQITDEALFAAASPAVTAFVEASIGIPA
jgi:erythritol transport system ATP-binding protein